MRIVGIGFDMISLVRFEKLYGSADADLLDRCFTKAEQAAVGEGIDRTARLAARFAAKEAAIKVLGGLEDGIALTDVEVQSTLSGAPLLSVHGGARSVADAKSITEWHLSMTHSDDHVGAVVVATAES